MLYLPVALLVIAPIFTIAPLASVTVIVAPTTGPSPTLPEADVVTAAVTAAVVPVLTGEPQPDNIIALNTSVRNILSNRIIVSTIFFYHSNLWSVINVHIILHFSGYLLLHIINNRRRNEDQ